MSWAQAAMMLANYAKSQNDKNSRPVKTGQPFEPLNYNFKLFPDQGSLLALKPIEYQTGPNGEYIPISQLAPLDAGKQEPASNAMDMDYQGNRTGGDNPQQKNAGPVDSSVDAIEILTGDQSQNNTPQRLPKTPEEMAHEIELEKMQSAAAMQRQALSSGASFLGGFLRPPSAVTVGGYRPNPNVPMYRRRMRGLMS